MSAIQKYKEKLNTANMADNNSTWNQSSKRKGKGLVGKISYAEFLILIIFYYVCAG